MESYPTLSHAIPIVSRPIPSSTTPHPAPNPIPYRPVYLRPTQSESVPILCQYSSAPFNSKPYHFPSQTPSRHPFSLQQHSNDLIPSPVPPHPIQSNPIPYPVPSIPTKSHPTALHKAAPPSQNPISCHPSALPFAQCPKPYSTPSHLTRFRSSFSNERPRPHLTRFRSSFSNERPRPTPQTIYQTLPPLEGGGGLVISRKPSFFLQPLRAAWGLRLTLVRTRDGPKKHVSQYWYIMRRDNSSNLKKTGTLLKTRYLVLMTMFPRSTLFFLQSSTLRFFRFREMHGHKTVSYACANEKRFKSNFVREVQSHSVR